MSTARKASPMAVAAALTATAALGLTYLVAVHTVLGQLVDTRIMTAVAEQLAGSAWTEAVLALVSPATMVLAAGSLAASAAALQGPRGALTVLVTTAGTAVGAVLLKAVLVRPQLLDDAANSLPSGHVAAVAGLVSAAALVAPASYRWLIVVTGLAAVGSTSLATLALEWHRPSDIVASMLLAVAVAAITCTVTIGVPTSSAPTGAPRSW
jgi:membrane-associated phospholipid phosphatase